MAGSEADNLDAFSTGRGLFSSAQTPAACDILFYISLFLFSGTIGLKIRGYCSNAQQSARPETSIGFDSYTFFSRPLSLLATR